MPPTTTAPLVRTVGRQQKRLEGPGSLVAGIVTNWHLIAQLTNREVLGRYKGSYLGLLWPFLNPIFLLVIYTLVFRFIFQARFSGRFGESQTDFALMLFAGLIIFNVFAECIARAPSLILLNASYVNRVVFPLEILPITIVLSSLFHLLMSFVPLVLVILLLKGQLAWTLLEWPLLLIPLLGFALGTTWLIAAAGVFLRDLSEVTLVATTILMYASAVFYPISVVADKIPGPLRLLVLYNPVARIIEQSRLISVAGQPLDLTVYGWLVIGAFICMMVGYSVFTRLKHTFADVV